jgi:hypothetical protein
MARSITVISKSLQDALVAAAAAVGITINPANWSKKDYKKLFIDIFATSQGIQEQLYDSAVEDIDLIAKHAAPQTPAWFQYQMLNLFQYDATTPQIIQLDVSNSFAPYYPIVNANFRIVKYCSVVPGTLGTTTIKLAGSGPAKLSAGQLSAAQSFINQLQVPGITYNAISLDADRLFMQLDVYYLGQYSNVIEANVTTAITAFLNTLSTTYFDGQFLTSLLQNAILAVPGVKDVVFKNIQARANTTTVGTGTNLILNNTELLRNWQMVAGYMIIEDTSGANWRLSDFRVGASGIKNLNLIAV